MAFLIHLHHGCGYALAQCWMRYTRGAAGLSLPQVDSEHGALHRIDADPVLVSVLRRSPGGSATFNSFGLLFDIAVGIELFEVGPKVVDLLIVLDAAKTIFVPRILALGSLIYSLKVASFQTVPEFLL